MRGVIEVGDRSQYFKQRNLHAKWFPTLKEILENHNVELGELLGPLELKRLDEMYKEIKELNEHDDEQ
jgi:hypothetical protein